MKTATVPMTSKARQAAASLAVSYAAYCKAVNASDLNGILVWGRILLNDQRAVGVVLSDEQLVLDNMESASRVLRQQEEAA